jgi:hypothetical protein
VRNAPGAILLAVVANSESQCVQYPDMAPETSNQSHRSIVGHVLFMHLIHVQVGDGPVEAIDVAVEQCPHATWIHFVQGSDSCDDTL